MLSLLLGMPHPTPSPAPSPPPQLNLIHSEVSNLAGFDVEGVINPTNAELELKDDLGELPHASPPLVPLEGLRFKKKKSLNVEQVDIFS